MSTTIHSSYYDIYWQQQYSTINSLIIRYTLRPCWVLSTSVVVTNKKLFRPSLLLLRYILKTKTTIFNNYHFDNSIRVATCWTLSTRVVVFTKKIYTRIVSDRQTTFTGYLRECRGSHTIDLNSKTLLDVGLYNVLHVLCWSGIFSVVIIQFLNQSLHCLSLVRCPLLQFPTHLLWVYYYIILLTTPKAINIE